MATTTPKARHRSFSAKKQADKGPLTFDLEGQKFEAHRQVPGAVLLDFMASAGEDGAGAAGAILPFFEDALIEEDYQRFAKLIKDPDVLIDMETLMEIIAYLIEEYADSRPS